MSSKIQNLSSKIYKFGFKNDFMEIIKLAVPLVLTNYSTFMIPFISMLFCGHIGDDELDAASLSNNLIDLCGFSIVFGLSSACDTLFPQFFGTNHKKSVGTVLQKGLIITVLGSFTSIAVLFNTKHLMPYFTKNDNVVKLADHYVLVYSPSLMFAAIGNVLTKYLQSQNIAYPVLIITFIINVINAVLNAIFIFVLKMDIRGAALACTISNFLLPVFTLVYIVYKKIYPATWSGWSIKCLDDWWSYYKLAIPAFVMILLEWLCFECGTFVSSFIGPIELGAQTIAQQTLVFCFMIPFGIGTAGCIRIGQLLGSNAPEEAKNASKVTVTICGFFILLVVVFLASSSSILPYAFTSDKDIKALASNLLLLIAATHLIDGTQASLVSVLRSIGAQFYGSITNFVGLYIIALPISLTLMLKTSLKVYGFWIGIIFGGTCLIIMQIFYIFRINWKNEAEKAVKQAQTEENDNVDLLYEIHYETYGSIQSEDTTLFIDTQTKKQKACLIIKKILFILALLAISGSLASLRFVIPTVSKTTNETVINNSTSLTTEKIHILTFL